MNDITSTLTIPFDSESTTTRITLERHSGFTGLKPGIPFRLYPQVDAKLICKHGTISPLPEYRYSTEKEVVAFSGSNTASLKRPLAINVELELIAVSFDDSGNNITPSLVFDETQQLVIADKPFYGAVMATYQAPYSLYFYEFKTQFNLLNSQTTIYSDTIYGFYRTSQASLPMNITIENESEWKDLYKITSRIVKDNNGTWEYPTDWAKTDVENKGISKDSEQFKKYPDGKYPDFSNYSVDPSMAFSDNRVHLVAEYNLYGRIRLTERQAEMYEPYVNNNLSFKQLASLGFIQFYLSKASKTQWRPSMKNTEKQWSDAFLSIDFNKILSELKYDYPNVKESR